MAKASTSKVYAASLTPEDLVHLIDISVASKYGVDLSQLTWVLAEDVRHTLDAFKQDWDNGLPRQIWSAVKEVISNMQGKQVTDTSSTAVLHGMLARGESSATSKGVSLHAAC
jgi:hypothetical protein